MLNFDPDEEMIFRGDIHHVIADDDTQAEYLTQVEHSQEVPTTEPDIVPLPDQRFN